MNETARDYITLRATGRNKDDFVVVQEIKRAILALLGDVVGYQVIRLENAEQIEDELRDSSFFLEASGGKLPFILVNVTYVTEAVDPARIAELETQFELRLVAEQVYEGP